MITRCMFCFKADNLPRLALYAAIVRPKSTETLEHPPSFCFVANQHLLACTQTASTDNEIPHPPLD